MPQLSKTQLESVVSGVAHMLDNLQIDYAIMGGAATCLLAQDPTRSTEDVDLVIHVDQRMITADRLTSQLLKNLCLTVTDENLQLAYAADTPLILHPTAIWFLHALCLISH